MNSLATNIYTFEHKYEILNMYQYLNHPYYNNFIQYLNVTNKIALIFCKSKDEIFVIPQSDSIKSYLVTSISDKTEILQEFRKDFDAHQAQYTIEPVFLREFRIIDIITDEFK